MDTKEKTSVYVNFLNFLHSTSDHPVCLHLTALPRIMFVFSISFRKCFLGCEEVTYFIIILFKQASRGQPIGGKRAFREEGA